MFSSAFVLLSLAASSFATVFVTQPVASTTCSGSQTCNIAWQDDGNTPTLQQFGNSKVSIYVGNAIQQTMVQSITTSVNVATTSAIQFTVDPNAGPDGDVYFIRFESLSAKDANNTQFPALAFSAKFTLNNMSGTFNASESSQIAGTSTAPLATPSAASVTAAASTASGKITTISSHSGSSTSTSTAKATATSASSAGRNVAVNSAMGVVGALAVMAGFVL